MKTKSALLSTAFAAIALFLSGCASQPQSQGLDTVGSIGSSTALIQKSIQQINGIKATLAELPKTSTLQDTFKKYIGQLNTLTNTSTALNESLITIGNTSETYFLTWKKNLDAIQNEDLRAISKARLDKVAETVRSIQIDSTKPQGLLSSALNDLNDLKTSITTDLTPNGVSKSVPFINKTSATLDNVIKSLTTFSEDLQSIQQSLKSTTPPAAGATSKK